MGNANKKRTQNALDYQGNVAQNRLNEQFQETGDKNRLATDDWRNAVGKQGADYDRIMSGYQDFAKTGGYSPDDIQNIRARAVSPLRSIYSSANQDIDRQRSLQGGYSPNYTASKAKMARELGSGIADASTNANAAIAEMQHAGKLQGLQGQNQLYGTTPALASLYGNQALEAQSQRLQAAGMQNQLGLGIVNAQNNIGQGGGIMGGLKSGLGLLGQGLGLLPKLFPGGGKNGAPENAPVNQPAAQRPLDSTLASTNPGVGIQMSPEANSGYGNNVPGYDDYAKEQEAKNPSGNTGVTITSDTGEPITITNPDTGEAIHLQPIPGAPGFYIGDDGHLYNAQGEDMGSYAGGS